MAEKDTHGYAGGDQEHTSAPWPEDVTSYITANNPNPVNSTSNAWVALANRHDTASCPNWCIAQVGWNKWSGTQYNTTNDGYAHYWAQWTDNTGTYKPAVFFGRTANNGTVSEHYEAYRWAVNGDGHFTLYFPGGSVSTPSTINWGPDTEVYSAEVGDRNQTTDNGSHVPGNKTTKAHFSSMYWYDQTGALQDAVGLRWFGCTDAGSCSTASGLSAFGYMVYAHGSSYPMSFDTWDSRCS
jgi:hypothetical protein